jgi:hypothetical protein
MKNLLSCLVVGLILAPQNNSAQAPVFIGMNGKITNNKQFGLDLKVGYKSTILNFGFTRPTKFGTVGEQMQTIGWNEFTEDIYEKGSYYEYIDFGIHYLLHKNILVGAAYGLGSETIFRNCYDRFEILGYDGFYYMTRNSGNKKHNFGFSFDYLFNIKESGFSIITGLSWSKLNNVAFNFGILGRGSFI